MLHEPRGRQAAGETMTQRSRSLPAAAPDLQQYTLREMSASRVSERGRNSSRGRPNSRIPLLRQ